MRIKIIIYLLYFLFKRINLKQKKIINKAIMLNNCIFYKQNSKDTNVKFGVSIVLGEKY